MAQVLPAGVDRRVGARPDRRPRRRLRTRADQPPAAAVPPAASQAIRWQSATATWPLAFRVASTSKSTHTTAQSGPSVALTIPISGVARIASPDPPAGPGR